MAEQPGEVGMKAGKTKNLDAALQEKNAYLPLTKKILVLLPLCLTVLLALVTAASGTGIATLVSSSADDQYSSDPSVSADGRFVAFSSQSPDLINSWFSLVFVRNTVTQELVLASADASGIPADRLSMRASISADGRYVAFESWATNLGGTICRTGGYWNVFVKDLQDGGLTWVNTYTSGSRIGDSGTQADPAFSANGRYVAFSAAPVDQWNMQIYVKDLQTGITTLVSTSPAGEPGNGMGSLRPAISADGRFVAFESESCNLVPGVCLGYGSGGNIFVKDTVSGNITVVSSNANGESGNSSSSAPFISSDGRFVAFSSRADNLVPGYTCDPRCDWYDENIYLKDILNGTITRASANANGERGNHMSTEPSVSDDGRYVAFQSLATNLVSGSTIGYQDAFIKDTVTGDIKRLSVPDPSGQNRTGFSWAPVLTSDGQFVAFCHGFIQPEPAISTKAMTASRSLTPLLNAAEGSSNGMGGAIYLSSTQALMGSSPRLALSKSNVYWASYDDYTAGLLTVDYSITNTGSDTANSLQLVGSTASNGVTCSTAMPISLGNVPGGTTFPDSAKVKYSVPAGVAFFMATVYVTAEDGNGNIFSYPGPWPGA